MRPKVSLLCICAIATFAITAFAQHGHPLKGTFSGDWWLKKGSENHLVLQFMHTGTYTSDVVTGILNPGPEAAPLQKLSLTPPSKGIAGGADPWLVHFEADAKDASGKTVHYVVDGKLENIGAYNKRLSGSWTAGSQKGQFLAVMQ